MTQMPTWDEFMVYVLKYLSKGGEHDRSAIRQGVSDLAGLTEAQRLETLPSGQFRAANRIGWAMSYLTTAGAIDRPSRARYKINPLGTNLLAEYPDGIPAKVVKGMTKGGEDEESNSSEIGATESLDPIEQIEEGLIRNHAAVATDLLQRLQGKDPYFFEAAVVKLLVAMGYGGADGKATVTQKSNDGGIDGIIDRDALGLDRVYIQAKRYTSKSIQSPDVHAFVGALVGSKATTGVFLTTSNFSKGATEYAQSTQPRVILIDGQRLTELMIRYGVGVQTRQILNVVAVDEDFFE
jgi:restriction system protein